MVDVSAEVRRVLRRRLGNAIDRFAPSIRVACDQNAWRYRLLERRVPVLRLPDPLLSLDGSIVEGVDAWGRRRAELLRSFEELEYGRTPPIDRDCVCREHAADAAALGGLATRKEVRISLVPGADGPSFLLLLYLPNRLLKVGTPPPVFLGLNFFGNQTVCADPGVSVSSNWVPSNSVTRGRTGEGLRGIQASSWPVHEILSSGFGLATAYCGEIVPDRPNALQSGLHAWCRANGLDRAAGDSWGAIGGWSWGLSRAMDYLCDDPDVDGRRVVLIGHSRLGKAALWAGAQDERFAIIVSNNSGRGGAALAMRKFGERVADINAVNPHWFCGNFRQFGGREETLPIDQHELIALIAPRPVYIASAQLDLAADPMGEFLAGRHADPVYRVLNAGGLDCSGMPPVNVPSMGRIGYHIRNGTHAITLFDWLQFLSYAEKHLPPPRG